ncbi:MAG TPA: PA2778 family cysteine peptidase [Gammaproteobacteria bacterium]|nr:PA2778 family cysteine peptidase [Gammaproteobacteria bacterium]
MSSISSIKSERLGILGACALTLSGCAGLEPAPKVADTHELVDVPELVNVPFFPQTEFDCGPAALATILNDAGVRVTPAELTDAVYVEGLNGSLQVELLAATRRHGLLPVPIPGTPEDLLAEIASGRPVLVLQNLRFARLPAWHYAVVVGYTAGDDRFVLRSGEHRRREERARRFLRSWQLADNWGFVAVTPGEIPVSAKSGAYMRALVGAARQLDSAAASKAYRAAVDHWPNDPLVLFLSASQEHAAANLEAAASLYRRAIEVKPEHAAARNNLANILLDQGCREAALHEAQAALSLHATDDSLRAAIADTLNTIQAAPQDSGTACDVTG